MEPRVLNTWLPERKCKIITVVMTEQRQFSELTGL